jgi:hypothetical protein
VNDTADCKVKVLSYYVTLPSAGEVAIAATTTSPRRGFFFAPPGYGTGREPAPAPSTGGLVSGQQKCESCLYSVALPNQKPSCFPSHFPCPCSSGSSCKQKLPNQKGYRYVRSRHVLIISRIAYSRYLQLITRRYYLQHRQAQSTPRE